VIKILNSFPFIELHALIIRYYHPELKMKIHSLLLWNLFFIPSILGQNFTLKLSALAPVSSNYVGNTTENYEVAIYNPEVGGLPSQSIGVWFKDGKLLRSTLEQRVWDIYFTPPDSEGRVYVYRASDGQYYGLLRFLGDRTNEVPYLGQRHQLGVVYGSDDRRYASEPTRFALEEDGQLRLTEYAGSTTNNNTISACYAFSVYSTDEQYVIIAGEITSTLFYHCEPIVLSAVSTNLPSMDAKNPKRLFQRSESPSMTSSQNGGASTSRFSRFLGAAAVLLLNMFFI